MMRALMIAATAAFGVLLAMPAAQAAERRTRVVEQGPQFTEHPKAAYYRKAPQVRGYVKRGGYSYSRNDSIIPYSNTQIFRDKDTPRQPMPFDRDFFFDSGVHRFNTSPYPN